MKLISGFILQDLGDEHMAVATGEAGKVFHGLVRSNDTADFIIRELMHETTEEEIVDRMVEKYDAVGREPTACVLPEQNKTAQRTQGCPLRDLCYS